MATEIKLGEQWSIVDEDGTNSFILKDRVNGTEKLRIDPNGVVKLEENLDAQNNDISNVGALSTDEAVVGTDDATEGAAYDILTNSDETILVDPGGGGDFTTIQDAVDSIPKWQRHETQINIATGTYDEDVIIRGWCGQTFTEGDVIADGAISAGEASSIRLESESGNASDVDINSITIIGCNGVQTPNISRVTLSGTTPYAEESASLAAFGTDEILVGNCEFTATADYAISSYRSNVQARKNTIGSGYQHGFEAKREAMVYFRNGTYNQSAETAQVTEASTAIAELAPAVTFQRDSTSRAIFEGDLIADGHTATNTTLIEAYSSGTSSISSGSWAQLADTEQTDNLSELDGSFNFNPGNSGWYQVEASVYLFGATDGDLVELAVRDVDSSSVVRNGKTRNTLAASNGGLRMTATVELSSGTNYQIQIKNNDSGFTLGGGGDNTWYRIKQTGFGV